MTIELSNDGAQKRISIVQDNNTTARELAHSEGGWRLTLYNLKALLEGAREQPSTARRSDIDAVEVTLA